MKPIVTKVSDGATEIFATSLQKGGKNTALEKMAIMAAAKKKLNYFIASKVNQEQ